MNLKVLLPSEVLVQEEVQKVIGEAENGSFCLLPRHIDFVAALEPGILVFDDAEGREVFLAVDEGICVKAGDDVLVSTRRAVRGAELGELRRIIQERFLALEEKDKKARSAMARIEANFVRRFLEIQHNA